MPLLCLAAFLIQCYFIGWALRGLKKLTVFAAPSNQVQRRYSIIITAHNEENNISVCLQALVDQEYPGDFYEIILAADRCKDKTVEIAASFQKNFPNLQIFEIDRIPPGISPKKYAISRAIERARFEYMLFLDADVIPTKNHIQTMNGYFGEDTAAVVSLMKFSEAASFWKKFLVFEKLVSWCIAGAGIGRQRPIIAYGGNWGYTKSAFRKINGFTAIDRSLSGDDDLLLQKMGEAKLPTAICLQPGGWVRTAPPKTFAHFFRQRRRHFSAGKKYRPRLQAGYFLYHASNLLLWTGWLFWGPALFFLLFKLLGDVFVIRQGQALFQEKISPLSIILYELTYLVYNTLVGPLGYIGRMKW
jgi:cellulose synthase/poly-beta-1,6-N-acetylglucosamine synthase-like glycosyltransferase